MYHELKVSPEQTVYYRYNPQGDVLAVRLEPRFEPGSEQPVDDLPGVSLTRDAASGACLGLRIEGVQQMILAALVRDVFGRLRPELEAAGAVAPAPVVTEEAPAAAGAAAEAPAEPAVGPELVAPDSASAATPEADDEPAVATARAAPVEAVEAEEAQRDRDRGRRTKRRRRRRRKKTTETEARRGPDEPAPPAEEAPAPAAGGAEPAPAAGGDARPTRPRSGIESAVSAVAAALRSGARGGEESAAGAETEAERPDATAEPGEAAAGPAETHGAHEAADAEVRPSEDGVETDPVTEIGSAVPADRPRVEAVDEPPATAAGAGEAPASGPDRAPEGFAGLGLHEEIGRAIARMGFDRPTPIQEQAVPVAMQGRDVVGLAQTGTGKTLAFVAPGLHRMLVQPTEGGRHVPRMLILAPTRELTVQVAEEAERIAAASDLRVTTIYGGVSMGPQIQDLKRGVDLIVATPGRMLDHLRRGNVSVGSVETLVLDEADRMLDMGFLPDVRTILRFLPAQRQTLFFTATMPPEIESLSLEFQKEPVTVEIARRKPPESIDQRLYPVGKHLKAPLLVHLLENDPRVTRALVFTERKIDADVLSRRLREEGLSVAVMHGDRRQQDREKALAALAEGRVQVLVATNVAARGLDIDDISHVINYDIPQSVDEYVHRIGRTARAEAEGCAWTLVTVSDEMMVSRIESALGRKLPRVKDESFDYDVPTPSWAKPSAKDVLAMLDRKQSVADRMRHLGRKR